MISTVLQQCVLDILDTAGQEEYSALRDQYIKTGDGFLIIYSITDRWSFAEAEPIYNFLLKLKNKESVPAVSTVRPLLTDPLRWWALTCTATFLQGPFFLNY